MLLSKDCVEMLESMYDHPENHLDESPDNSCMETLAETAEANKKSQEAKIMSIISIVISAAAVIVSAILHFI